MFLQIVKRREWDTVRDIICETWILGIPSVFGNLQIRKLFIDKSQLNKWSMKILVT